MNDQSSFLSPMYEAQHAPRYERQRLICEYQELHSCRFIVMQGPIYPYSVTLLEETLFDANPAQNLHIMLHTLGGDGETALRLIRQAQSRCKELTVIVPDQAKSAGTLFVLGADHIYMGPTSDLGPIDPQFQLGKENFVSGKAIISAVEDAEKRVQENPQTYTIHAALLGDITALMVQQARDQISRTGDQLKEALACVSSRDKKTVDDLAAKLNGPLIDNTQSHQTVISAQSAINLGLPVQAINPTTVQWKAIWRMWAKYAMLNATHVYEGQSSSQVFIQHTN